MFVNVGYLDYCWVCGGDGTNTSVSGDLEECGGCGGTGNPPSTPKPFEVFVKVGHADPCEQAYTESLGRVLSIALQYGVPPEELIHQLEDLKCVPHPDPEGGYIQSPSDGIAKMLRKFISTT